MTPQIEALREVFTEWLRLHDLDYDYRAYTQEEWSQKEDQANFFGGAELVLAFENQLVQLLDEGILDTEEELQDLAGAFGYYFERGHSWSIGFYPLENWPPLPDINSPYPQLLSDLRWRSKRKRILKRSNGSCEHCGMSDGIEVHHCYYRYGRFPWQYPDAALLALCRGCHTERAKVELDWRGFMPQLSSEELQLLKRLLQHGLYWFDRSSLFRFFSELSTHDADPSRSLQQLCATRSHPHERDGAA